MATFYSIINVDSMGKSHPETLEAALAELTMQVVKADDGITPENEELCAAWFASYYGFDGLGGSSFRSIAATYPPIDETGEAGSVSGEWVRRTITRLTQSSYLAKIKESENASSAIKKIISAAYKTASECAPCHADEAELALHNLGLTESASFNIKGLLTAAALLNLVAPDQNLRISGSDIRRRLLPPTN